ncbi:hypothetical protein COV49_03690 [Candidatus Falkowbacteria bacterium CG11_big_fil_rev_8_21_14_0_20_39_10]|uniref:Glycosyltransferase subfamily 4-like N-terminal domain-containing protein n=1 Tax=Candidatus Falkowbacteria bacterium CG11_big_fil_rev_8_21_14_0_20_39_10 TaxID=1974570 RepID=A0A2M6K8N4_9BACT|nr:MAG: hypothetical protein COV49_03690 [Candidatus Falkowbacteria bacterium CG11_big_fil_rev_8_21_14_0_20_39_10]
MTMKKEKLKVLCISLRTPPAVRPQAILIGKMIPEWIRQGVEPVAVTYEGGEDWDIDIPVYKIPQFKINRYLNKLILLRWFLRFWYYKKISQTIAEITKKHNCQVLFSFANPVESNVIGAKVKKLTGIKYVSHFSDPWYDHPYENFSWRQARKILRQEKEFVSLSDWVIFVTKQMRELVMKKYPAEWKKRTEVIPHCYDLKDYVEVEKNNDKFVISYIGVFYKERNPKPLFAALKKAIDRDKSLKSKFRMDLIGAANNYSGYSQENIKKMLAEYDLDDVTEILPFVEYKESLRLMKLADCLVVIDANFSNSPFLPSKVVDYAATGTPILGITPKGSPPAEFLENFGCRSFDYRQIDELSDYLDKLIKGEIKVNLNQEFLKQYDVRETSKRLINIFREVLK